MPKIRNQRQKLTELRSHRGFSMIELMVVVAVMTIIMGAVFKSINTAQKTSRSEQIKLDTTQQARDFVDQLTTDLRNSGYPYVRNMANAISDPNNGNAAPYNVFTSAYDPYNAPGLIYVDSGSLWFAGAVDGTASAVGNTSMANVKIVRYDYFANGQNCPCLRRTEFLRNGGDPFTDASNPGAAIAQLEIQGVQNGAANDPIFTVYDSTGKAITLPINFDTGSTIASINSLKVLLRVQSPFKDSTGAYPSTTVISSVALNNCSEAMVNGQTPPYCK